MSESELLTAILQGGAGVIAMLLLIIWWGRKGIWVWGEAARRELDTCREERKRERKELDEWKQLALDSLGIAEAVTDERAQRGDRQ